MESYYHLHPGQPQLPPLPLIIPIEQLPYLAHLQPNSTTTIPTAPSTQTPAGTSTTNTPPPFKAVQQVNPPTQYDYQRLAYDYEDAIQQNHYLKQQAQEKDNNHQAEVHSLKTCVSAKEKEIGELIEELEKLKTVSPKVTKKHLNRVKSLVKENKELFEKNKELTSKQIQPTFFDENTEWEAKINNAESEINSLKSQLERFRDDNISLISKHISLELEISRVNKELKTLEKENKKITTNLKASETQRNTMKTNKLRNESLSEQIAILNSDYHKLTIQFKGVQVQNQELEQKLMELKDLNLNQAQNFKVERQSFEKMKDALETEKQSLVERVKHLECENKDRDSAKSNGEKVSSKQVNFLHGEIEDVSKEMKKVKNARKQEEPKQIMAIKNGYEVIKQNEELNQTRIQLQNASQKVKELQSELEELKKSPSSQQQQLQHKLDLESERLREAVKTINDKSNEVEMLKRDAKKATMSLKDKHERLKMVWISRVKKRHEELLEVLRK
ncbi:unnamed protein product [Orchesella dallaii]|uniref:Uncharacterized protein n=1 Tax=Orchesella dallaii TaxID=48710 RepID=A0ABP1R079_9HEXA